MAVLESIEDLAVMPELGENPVAKDLLWRVARNLHGYAPKDREPPEET